MTILHQLLLFSPGLGAELYLFLFPLKNGFFLSFVIGCFQCKHLDKTDCKAKL